MENAWVVGLGWTAGVAAIIVVLGCASKLSQRPRKREDEANLYLGWESHFLPCLLSQATPARASLSGAREKAR